MKFFSIVFFGLVMAIPSACGSTPNDGVVEITNFKAGLVCSQKSDDQYVMTPKSICFEADTVEITGQGQCKFNGSWVPCTWYGFEFEYSNVNQPTSLECEVSTDTPQNYGNPDEINETDVETTSFSISLDPGSHRYFNPQYTVFRYSTGATMKSVSRTICRHNGEVVFDFNRTVVIPSRNGDN